MPNLPDAIALAAHAHYGQKEKNGKPYLFHPLRLMMKMRSEAEMIVAVLHDVVEDTDVTLEDLRNKGYSTEVVKAIDCLTQRGGGSYDQYISRIKSNDLARRVKIADLEDNLDLSRIPRPTDEDLARMQRYRKALASLKTLL